MADDAPPLSYGIVEVYRDDGSLVQKLPLVPTSTDVLLPASRTIGSNPASDIFLGSWAGFVAPTHALLSMEREGGVLLLNIALGKHYKTRYRGRQLDPGDAVYVDPDSDFEIGKARLHLNGGNLPLAIRSITPGPIAAGASVNSAASTTPGDSTSSSPPPSLKRKLPQMHPRPAHSVERDTRLEERIALAKEYDALSGSGLQVNWLRDKKHRSISHVADGRCLIKAKEAYLQHTGLDFYTLFPTPKISSVTKTAKLFTVVQGMNQHDLWLETIRSVSDMKKLLDLNIDCNSDVDIQTRLFVLLRSLPRHPLISTEATPPASPEQSTQQRHQQEQEKLPAAIAPVSSLRTDTPSSSQSSSNSSGSSSSTTSTRRQDLQREGKCFVPASAVAAKLEIPREALLCNETL